MQFREGRERRGSVDVVYIHLSDKRWGLMRKMTHLVVRDLQSHLALTTVKHAVTSLAVLLCPEEVSRVLYVCTYRHFRHRCIYSVRVPV